MLETSVIAILIGFLITDFAFRVIKLTSSRSYVLRLRLALIKCYQAKNDEEREVAMREAGLLTVRFSLLVLISLSMAALLVLIPLKSELSIDYTQYLIEISLTSLLLSLNKVKANKIMQHHG